MSPSCVYIRGKSSQWPHSIKAWRPHILLWCSPVLEEEQVCSIIVELGVVSDSTPRQRIARKHFARNFPVCILNIHSFFVCSTILNTNSKFYLKSYCGSISKIFLFISYSNTIKINTNQQIKSLCKYLQTSLQAKRLHCFIGKQPLT